MKIVYENGVYKNDWRGVCVGEYEYICVVFEDYKDIVLRREQNRALEAQGWTNLWTDVTEGGAFAVYRRGVNERVKQ